MAPYGTSLSKAFKIPGSASPDVLSSALPTILDSLHQKPMDADAVTASTELKPSEISINGTDSGYASAATSPDNGGSGSQETFTDCIPYPARRSFHRRVVQLRPFEMEISEPVQNRFSDLVELFEKPLYNHLARSQNHLTAISIKLKVLGASELTAKPWIVILCQHQVSPRVKQFFNQQHIKSEYQPHHVEDSLPSFGLVVFSRPPRSIAARISVKRSPMIPMNHSYYYGASIKVDTLSRARFATLGGLINVTTAEGVCTSYGMTAGHVAIQSEDEDQRLLQADASNDPLSSTFVAEVDFDGEEEFEIDENHLNAKESYLFEHEFDFSELLGHDDDEDDESWLEAGRIHANSYDYESRGPNLDWALLQVDDPPKELLLSNLLNVSRLKGPSPSASSTTVQMEVTLLTAKFRKFGWLSTASSFLRTGPARGFTKTYSLTVAGGSRLLSGDCGSWVMSSRTGEILGHIVAVDSFNEVYVVPLQDTLKDMKERLGVASVALLTAADLPDIPMDTSNEVVSEADAYKPLSGYDSGYVTMESSPVPPVPLRDDYLHMHSSMTAGLPGTGSESLNLWEISRQVMDKSLPPTPGAFDDNNKTLVDDSLHDPWEPPKRKSSNGIKDTSDILPKSPKQQPTNSWIKRISNLLKRQTPDAI